MSEKRDWDKELAAIDKVMAKGPAPAARQQAALPAGAPAAQPAARPQADAPMAVGRKV